MSIPSSRPQFRPQTKVSTPPASPLPNHSRSSSRAGSNSVLKSIVPPPISIQAASPPVADKHSHGLATEAPRIRSRLTPLATPTRRIPTPSHSNPSNLLTPIKRKVAFPVSEPISRNDNFKNPFLSTPKYQSSTGMEEIESGMTGLGLRNVEEMKEPLQTRPKENVKVTVRIRPAAAKLASSVGHGNLDEAWEVNERGAIVLKGGNGVDYNFDAVVKSIDNEAIYQAAAKDLVEAAMCGYDAVVFAYGQTASGKTFTLGGSSDNPGITPRAVDDIFAYIREHPEKDFLLRASYLEIYNETLKDLLSPEATGLRIRQDEQKRFFVTPLQEEVVTGEVQVAQLLQRGANNRSTGKTDFNERSSRSHSLFQMTIESRATGLSSNSCRSTLSIIDLAGSETATSQNERKAEGAFINKSLLALEKVISSLTEKNKTHIPFRDSKLTQLLQPSLSGSALVSVIATLNPSMTAIAESTSTLKFAQRVKKVTLKAVVHEVIDDKMLISKYRSHIAMLESQLLQASSQISSTPRSDYESEKQLNAMREEILELQNLFLNSSNLDDRRQSLAPPRAVSPMKGEKSREIEETKFQDTLDLVAAQEDKISELHQRIAELEEAALLAKHSSSEIGVGENDIVTELMKDNRELRLVINQVETENQTSFNLQELRWQRVLTTTKSSLEEERTKNQKFEKFIVEHLTSRSNQLNHLSPSRNNLLTPSRNRNLSFGIESISNQEFELDEELEDLHFSEEGRAMIRSASTMRLEQ